MMVAEETAKASQTDRFSLQCVRVERIAFPVTNIQIISPLHREVLFRSTQCTPTAAESACHQMLISFHCKCCEIPLASADLHQIYRGVRLASGLAPLVNEC